VCAHLSDGFERAEELFQRLLEHTRSNLARARIQDRRVVLSMTREEFADAMRFGLEGIALLGLTLPETAEEQRKAFQADLADVSALLGDRKIEDLVHAPVDSVTTGLHGSHYQRDRRGPVPIALATRWD
jgi:predicted ATPase